MINKIQIAPKKGLGQNFLRDQQALAGILAAATVGSDDIIVEIGPGTGFLTTELVKTAKKVIAIEKDPELVKLLKENVSAKNLEIVQDDVRGIDLSSLGLKAGDYKVVANIPYYLTAFLLRSFLEADCPPQDLTLVMQKEVAQRICAQPPKMNLLSASVQFYAAPKIYGYIKKTSFWPVPKVDSAIIKISVKRLASNTNKELFFKIIHAGFVQPRKMLLNNLATGLKMDKEEVRSWLLANNIQPTQRAETLSLESWLSLTKTFFRSIK